MKNNSTGQLNKSKIIIPIVLIVGIFVGAVVVLKVKGIGAEELNDGKKIFVSVASDPDADPDADGLKNWEEELYKTDPRNPDSDGDGYTDGEEVLTGYDPTIPGPDDAIDGTDTSSPRPIPQNLTDYLSQIVTEKVTSGEIKPVSDAKTASDSTLLRNEEVFNEALLQISEKAAKDFQLITIPDSEILISEKETTKEELRVYVFKVADILSKNELNLSSTGMLEAEIIANAVEDKNYQDLEIITTLYEDNIKSLKSVTVPKEFVDLHKEQLAILDLARKILTAVRNFEDDPATAAAAVEKYPELKNLLESFVKRLITKVDEFKYPTIQ